MADSNIDWDSLRAAAREVAGHAYAPYSGLRVGTAALVDDGRVVTGCNVENASYGLTLCAECGLVSDLHSSGGGRLVAVSVVAGDGRQLTPCGRCRQLLLEHGGPGCSLDTPQGITTVGAILPAAFDTAELEGRRED
ncbi:MAG: cytidine deaminase [Actinomycetota bacterium]